MPRLSQVDRPSVSDRLARWVDRLVTGAPEGRAISDIADGPTDEGRLIWFRCPDGGAALALSGLIRRLDSDLPEAVPFVTVGSGPLPDPEILSAYRGPPEDPAILVAFLDRWQPAAAVLIGQAFLPQTVQALAIRQVPTLGAAIRLPSGHWMERGAARLLARRHLARFRHLMTEDAGSLGALLRCGAPHRRASVGGTLTAEVAVPPASEAERASLADLMTSRPVWCAAALPLEELDPVAEAQNLAMKRSHRLLLVIIPADPADGAVMRARLAEAGVAVGLRSDGDDPDEDTSVYIADLEGELGLWLRLAPVTYIGGTLSPGTVSRTPMEAAALGSAILHGPEILGHAADHARLDAARAGRMVRDAETLAAEVETLMAPDQAAAMAHAAWQVSSAGDEGAVALLARLTEILHGEKVPA
jgi:3-deoxy-D-manno-octulosonic-acid transferase